MITFEGIRKVYEEEKKNPGSLSVFPSNFFSEIRQYIINRRSSENSSEELDTVKRRLDSIFEMRERKIINGSLDYVRTGIKPANMLESEEELFRSIVSKIEKFHDDIAKILMKDKQEDKSLPPSSKNEAEKEAEEKSAENSAVEGKPFPNNEKKPSEPVKETENEEKITHSENPEKDKPLGRMSLIEITEDIHEFMGIDMKPYGPFKKGELGNIPEENAKVIQNLGKGIIIRTS